MAEPRRERKVVTVVFCDLVGFTQRAEALDPEDVEALLRPVPRACPRTSSSGTAGRSRSSSVTRSMALFGAPVAMRTIPSAPYVPRSPSATSRSRTGSSCGSRITTGEALVSLDASPAEGEGMASGDVVNTAARLQSAAPVNGILVDETTYRATRSVVDYEEASPVDAKGKAQPIPSGRRPRCGRGRESTSRTSLARSSSDAIRSSESCATRSTARARARTSQLVTLVGVPGIGKSRLVHELRGIVDADPDLITWRQGRCLAYGDGVTMWALERDRQGAGRHPRAGSADGSGREGPYDRRGAAHRLGRRILGRVEPALAHRARIREPARRRSPRRGVFRVAPLLRGDGRAPPPRSRLRGSPLGGREPPRLRRRARRVGHGRAAVGGCDRAARASRASRPAGAAAS